MRKYYAMGFIQKTNLMDGDSIETFFGYSVYWVADFGSLVRIESILTIGLQILNPKTNSIKLTVGDFTTNNYNDNPECIDRFNDNSGWFKCALTGRYLALFSY